MAMRLKPGARIEPQFLGALVVDGGASVKGETLGVWNFVYADEGDERAPMSFPQGATLLTLTMR